MKRLFTGIFLVAISVTYIFAQGGRKMTRSEYIDTYKDLAMEEMERTGIPASITLAQGVLESGDGNSRLARKGNNHFGIKCHDWKGKTIYEDDDEENECFRKYKSVKDSYRDHSNFIATRQRYAFLFNYAPDDYKSWAKGLKKAGYATSPTYTKNLLKVIKDYQLYQYDEQVLAKTGGKIDRNIKESDVEYAGGRRVYYNNRVKYVIAREGDTFTSLSEELDMFSWQLPKYNDLPVDSVMKEGERVYIQPKRNRAEAGRKFHKVQPGETLQSISQLYAIKVDKLARRNGLNPDSQLTPGMELTLRRRNKNVKLRLKLPKINTKKDKPDNNNDEDFKVDLHMDN